MVSNQRSSHDQITSFLSLCFSASIFDYLQASIVTQCAHAELEDNLLLTHHLGSSPDALRGQHLILMKSQGIKI